MAVNTAVLQHLLQYFLGGRITASARCGLLLQTE